jgi:hypothetical protein
MFGYPLFEYKKLSEEELLAQKIKKAKQTRSSIDQKIKECDQQVIELEQIYKQELLDIEKMKKQYVQSKKDIDELIEKYQSLQEEQKNKSGFRLFKEEFMKKFGNEPYFQSFEAWYNEVSKFKNLSIDIIKTDNKFSLIVEAAGLSETESAKVKLLKDVFNHINKML